jgi:hypothetical protein
MIAGLLQLLGFLASLVFLVIYYLKGGHSVWAFLYMASFVTHFVGDFEAAFLLPALKFGNIDIKGAVKPPKFTQFVGIMLMVGANFLFIYHHTSFGGAAAFLGAALALVGFVWDTIYP